MPTVLVTGADGFIGKNLVAVLDRAGESRVLKLTRDDGAEEATRKLRAADVIFHLAGVNRPKAESEFSTGNVGVLQSMLEELAVLGRRPTIVFSSSIQATEDNAYGRSKLEAEQLLRDYAARSGATVVVYRLPNVFGKWARPNYNSVVATFCNNAAHGRPLEVHDPERVLSLVYVDDVVSAFAKHIGDDSVRAGYSEVTVEPVQQVSLAELAETIRSFPELKRSLGLPKMSSSLVQQLYATYLSYVPVEDLAYFPLERSDERGKLVELLKGPEFGQIFVSTTRPGVTRGNHFHHTKVEKFCVVSGEGEIGFRDLSTGTRLYVRATGDPLTIIDIPPGFVHNIRNVGASDMVVLFWASEVFDPERPDTYYEEV